MQDLPSSYITPPPKKGMSCFAKGCVFIAAIIGLIFIVICGGCIYVQQNLGAFVGDHQIALRPNTTTNEQYQAALRKLQPLVGMESPGQAAATSIDLTADDLNAMLAHDPHLADAKDKCFITLNANQMGLETSMEVPQKSQQARSYYFNARVVGEVIIANGEVSLKPEKIESLSGKGLPAWIMRAGWYGSAVDAINKSINEDIRKNTDLTDMVAKIASAKVENGHLILTLKPPTAATPEPGGSPVAAPAP